MTPWTAALQASLFFTISQSLLKFMSIKSLMISNHLILCAIFSFCLQSFPASGSFPVNRLFTSCGQSIGFSFSISPSNEYSGLISFKIDWFDLLAVQGTLKNLLQHPLDFLGWIIFKLWNLNLYWNVNEQSFTWWQRLTGISVLQTVNHGSSVGKWLSVSWAAF